VQFYADIVYICEVAVGQPTVAVLCAMIFLHDMESRTFSMRRLVSLMISHSDQNATREC